MHVGKSSMDEERWQEMLTKLDLERECSASSEGTCWLCDELENWNSVLNAVQLDLNEWQVGKLKLRTQERCPSEDFDKLNASYNAAYFLAWLPKKHSCIDAISLGRGCPRPYGTTVPDSITAHASNLRHVSITGDETFDWSIVLDALLPIQQLESLKVRRLVTFSRGLAVKLAQILSANSSSVNTIAVSEVFMSRSASDILVNGITKCENLRLLSLGVSLQPAGLRDFLTFLRSAQTLHTLHLPEEIASNGCTTEAENDDQPLDDASLQALNSDFFEDPLTMILTELEYNNGVTCLTISGCDTDPIHIDSPMGALLKSVLCKNRCLRVLALQGCYIDCDGARQISEGLRENTTLQCLNVSASDVESSPVQILCSALKQNKSLSLLKIGFCMSTPSERKALSTELARNQWYRRVQLRWKDMDTGGLISAMSDPLLCPTELQLHTNEFSPESFSALCSALSCNLCVKELTVCLWEVTSTHVASLRSMLEKNYSLKSLTLSDRNRKPGFAVMVSQGLYSNKSVTNLALQCDEMSTESTELLATLLKTNENLHKMVLSCRRGLTPDSLDAISQALLQNLFITEVNVGCITPAIRLAIQRNVSSLHRAAKFVLRQDVGKSCAEAFELLESKASLISCLKSTSRMSETEAKAAVKTARKFIWSNYLFINQIVSRKLECHAGEGTQIDKLNFECWIAITKHLRVSDVSH
ncbi:NACHT, LRR and PYD domains-containing protein 14-like [Amblyomma americanum]